jgi:hypothetical protein
MFSRTAPAAATDAPCRIMIDMITVLDWFRRGWDEAAADPEACSGTWDPLKGVVSVQDDRGGGF